MSTEEDKWIPIDLYSYVADTKQGSCNRCGRSTWTKADLGTEDRMTQPDGNPCGGRFV